MKILKFNESDDYKSFTEDEVNSFTEDEQRRLIFAYGDGQGDTYLEDLEAIKYNYNEDLTLIQVIDNLYSEYGGNMVKAGWIENNKLMEVLFK